MLKAEKYLRPVGVGVTAPHLIQADDGCLYVVKLQENKLGRKVLLNEYLACQFMPYVDLCFPPAELMRFDEKFIERSLLLRRHKIAAGLQFASRFIEGAQYVHRYNLPFVRHKGRTAAVILFDHLFYNADRTLNRKNLLLSRCRKGYRFYAIDNSHLFGSGRWRTERLEALCDGFQLNSGRAYGILLHKYLSPADFDAAAQKFKQLTPRQLREFVEAIPHEWIDEPTAAAIKSFLPQRFAYVDMIADKLKAISGGRPEKHETPDN